MAFGIQRSAFQKKRPYIQMPNAGCRMLVYLLALCMLVSCDFHPIYGSHGENTPVAVALNQVAIDNIPDRQGQTLRNELIDRMYGKGRPHDPKYHLTISLRETEEGIGLLPNATTTLTELTIYADYSLTDEKGKVLTN